MNLSFINKLFPVYIEKEAVQEPVFSFKRMTAFFFTLIQLIAILYIVKNFNIEKSSGIWQISLIIIFAFTINSFIPLRYRQFILFSTCTSVIYFAFGFFTGTMLIVAALIIIGICHLPIKFWIRLSIIFIIFISLFILRIEWFYLLRATLISPFLASIFMFRIIIYLYELKHGMIPSSIWQSLVYFFLFPNICFLFFPIVDYKTYSKTYYNIADNEIWQKGVRWMLRGLLHILAYRLVYYYFLISPAKVIDISSLLQYILSSYALILRLSGLFHFILGLLCLFGLNLPQAFNNYFLAKNFTDLWRRINIYWREFMLKIFFYPIMFKLKKKISKNLLPTTMLCVFIISWAFHGYQWFWIRGYYTFNILDLTFWLVLGTCITLNAVIQEKQSHIIARQYPLYAVYFLNMLKILGMIFFMSTMWSLWGSSSFNEWFFLISKATVYSPRQFLIIVISIISVISLGFLIQILLNKDFVKKIVTIQPQFTLSLTLPSLLILLCCSFNSVQHFLPAKMELFIKTLSEEKLNDNDKEKAEESYYKKLIDGEENTATGLWEMHLKRPRKFNAMDDVYIRTDDLLTKIYKPNYTVNVNGHEFKTNSFGLRDKEYEFIKPENTFRIALLGGSYEMGSGVSNSEVFESLTEQKLNDFAKDSIIANYEIFNFAAGGFYLVQHVELCHTKVFQYKPNAVLYVAHSGERWRLINTFANLIGQGKDLKYPLLTFIKNKAGIKQTMSKTEMQTRLMPYADVLISWSYSEISKLCYQNKAIPIWVYLPTTADTIDIKELSFIKGVANKCHYLQIDLTGLYNTVNIKEIIVSEWDTHPNAKGHALIADKLFNEMMNVKQKLIQKK